MSFLGAVGKFLSGGTGEAIVGFVRDRWPPSMSDQQRAEMEALLTEATRDYELKLQQLAAAQDAEFNQRIKDLEGTAADLKGVWLLGPIVIFLRGLQRPVWGYCTLYLDFVWFTTDTSGWSEQQATAMIVINLIVLFFLFGERAAKNIMPLVKQVFAK